MCMRRIILGVVFVTNKLDVLDIFWMFGNACASFFLGGVVHITLGVLFVTGGLERWFGAILSPLLVSTCCMLFGFGHATTGVLQIVGFRTFCAFWVWPHNDRCVANHIMDTPHGTSFHGIRTILTMSE